MKKLYHISYVLKLFNGLVYIRNITGRVSYYDGSNAAAVFYTPEGAFSGESNVIRPNRVSGSAAVSSIFGVLRFNASSQVPTAGENRPLNIGMTPAIYLGV